MTMTEQPTEAKRQSRAPGDLRPALRDPTPNEALRRTLREEARRPVSQRYALPPALVEPEPLPLDGPLWNEPASYEEGMERMQTLRESLKRYEELLLAERAHDQPDPAYLKRIGRDKFRVQERMKPLRLWLNARAVERQGMEVVERERTREEAAERVTALLGGPVTAERLLTALYLTLDKRINSVPEEERVVTQEERIVLSSTRKYLRAQGLDPLAAAMKGEVV